MAWLIPFLLLAWPFAEIALFISVADRIGWLPAIGLILLSGVFGVAVLTGQDVGSARRMTQSLRHGEMPVEGLFDQACRALAGLLLLLPGFLSDLLALGLLLPPLRDRLRKGLLNRIIPVGPATADRQTGSGQQPGTVIDGDFTVIDDEGRHPPDDKGGNPGLPGR